MDTVPLSQAYSAYAGTGGYPIGVVATLTGLPVDLIRAWERRYGLPTPARTEGRHRLYSPRDVLLLRRAATLRTQGLTAASACAQALAENTPQASDVIPAALAGDKGLTGETTLSTRLVAATMEMDSARASVILSEAGATFDLIPLWQQVLAPSFVRLGESWARGAISPAPEHLLTGLVRARLTMLLETLPRPTQAGRAVVGTGPGELHDLAALILAILLAREGWAVTWLGANIPPDALCESVTLLQPLLILLTAVLADHTTALLDALQTVRQRFGERTPHLAYGGPAFARLPLGAFTPGATFLGEDLFTALSRLPVRP